MKKNNLVLLVSIFLFCGNLYSQEFEVPKGYKFKKADDYSNYEKDIIAAAKWLEETPLNEQVEKRKEVSLFVFTWVNGSPTVTVELNENILNFEKKNPGMLIIYMASCARYVLENNYSKDMRKKQEAALKSLINVYTSGKGIKKDKKMDKLVQSEKDGELNEWLDQNLKIN